MNVGSRVWYDGKILEVVGRGLGKYDRPFLTLWDGCSDSTTAVSPEDVEVPVKEIFGLGEQVASFNTFRGVVTGFEEDTNRVICRSNYNHVDDRRRYAYKASELQPAPKLFELGNCYMLHAVAPGVKAVRVIAKNFPQEGLLRLADVHTDHTVVIVPEDVVQKDLQFFGIRAVEEL